MSLKNPPTKPTKESVEKSVYGLTPEMLKTIREYKSVNAKGRGNKKLNENQQLELMELIARFSKPQDIIEYFVLNHRIVISRCLIEQYQRTKKWQEVIKELRNKYLLSTDQVALSHKRVRMERRDDLYHRALKTNQLRTAAIVIRDAEVEMGGGQGKAPSFNITLNQYNELTDKELEEKRQELLERLGKKPVLEIPKET